MDVDQFCALIMDLMPSFSRNLLRYGYDDMAVPRLMTTSREFKSGAAAGTKRNSTGTSFEGPLRHAIDETKHVDALKTNVKL